MAKSIPISTPNISPISRLPILPSVSKSIIASKKKDSRNEKSLETTLEKLTQNRHKELSSRVEAAEEAKAVVEDAMKTESKEKVSPESPQTSCSRHTESSLPSSSHTCSSITKTLVHPPDNDGTSSIAPPTEVKESKEPATQVKLINLPVSTSTSSKTTESAVSTMVGDKDRSLNSLSIADKKSENPERTVTEQKSISEFNGTVKITQCTANNKDESSGSKTTERNNDLSDKKNSENIVKGSE